MLHTAKRRLYFVVAAYFAFWARIVLRRWRPRIVVITGSSGKTTLLHLVEAQLGGQAAYSHHANSAIGIPFHILGLPPNVGSRLHWLSRFVLAPLCIFRRLPRSKLYIVEADCDRPGEGAFIGRLLKPEVTLWVSVYRTHSASFDKLVKNGVFKTHEEAIAYEFGNYVACTKKLVVANGDQPDLVKQLDRVGRGVEVSKKSIAAVSDFQLTTQETIFTINGKTLHLPGLHPKELGISLQLCNQLLDYLGVPLDTHYSQLQMPPGRSSVLAGYKQTVLIDSTYNTGLDATIALLNLFQQYPHAHKWLVIADILEQGSLEREEHEKLATAILAVKPERVILLGRRTKTHTYPKLKAKLGSQVMACITAGEVLAYLEQELKGGEAVLFKGALGLEGVIEALLANPADASHLVRREPIWVKRRQAWGLPK